jgi:hypothetical protein
MSMPPESPWQALTLSLTSRQMLLSKILMLFRFHCLLHTAFEMMVRLGAQWHRPSSGTSGSMVIPYPANWDAQFNCFSRLLINQLEI